MQDNHILLTSLLDRRCLNDVAASIEREPLWSLPAGVENNWNVTTARFDPGALAWAPVDGLQVNDSSMDGDHRPEPRCVVAMWNLDQSHTEEDLQHELIEVDFEPKKIVQCGRINCAFRLSFEAPYTAPAIGCCSGPTPET